MKKSIFSTIQNICLFLVVMPFLSGVFSGFTIDSKVEYSRSALCEKTGAAPAKLPAILFRLRNARSGRYLAIGAGDPNQKVAIQWANVRQQDITWVSDGEAIWNGQTGGLIGAKDAADDIVEHRWLNHEEFVGAKMKWDMKQQADGSITILNKGVNKYLGIEAGANNDGDKAILKLLISSSRPGSTTLPVLSKEFFWYLEPVFISRYKVSVKTGGDDLRGGSSAFAIFGSKEFLLSTGLSPNTYNRDTNFDHIVGQNKNCAGTNFAIRHDGTPKSWTDTYDNWDMEKVTVWAITNYGCQIKVLDSQGLRFTGELRRKEFFMSTPFLCQPNSVPG